MDANQNQVFVAADHEENLVTLYLSDPTGQFYVPTLEHIVSDQESGWFQLDIDLYEVRLQAVQSVILFVCGFTSPLRFFLLYGDMTITSEGLQILTYTRHSLPLSSEASPRTWVTLMLRERLTVEYKQIKFTIAYKNIIIIIGDSREK